MSFDCFYGKILVLACKAGHIIRVKVTHEDGKHIARFSDGMVITGNTSSNKVCVRWGSGHQAMATL